MERMNERQRGRKGKTERDLVVTRSKKDIKTIEPKRSEKRGHLIYF